MRCYACDAQLIWCCDYDADEYDEGYSIVTDLSCPECDSVVVVYWGEKNIDEDNDR